MAPVDAAPKARMFVKIIAFGQCPSNSYPHPKWLCFGRVIGASNSLRRKECEFLIFGPNTNYWGVDVVPPTTYSATRGGNCKPLNAVDYPRFVEVSIHVIAPKSRF